MGHHSSKVKKYTPEGEGREGDQPHSPAPRPTALPIAPGALPAAGGGDSRAGSHRDSRAGSHEDSLGKRRGKDFVILPKDGWVSDQGSLEADPSSPGSGGNKPVRRAQSMKSTASTDTSGSLLSPHLRGKESAEQVVQRRSRRSHTEPGMRTEASASSRDKRQVPRRKSEGEDTGVGLPGMFSSEGDGSPETASPVVAFKPDWEGQPDKPVRPPSPVMSPQLEAILMRKTQSDTGTFVAEGFPPVMQHKDQKARAPKKWRQTTPSDTSLDGLMMPGGSSAAGSSSPMLRELASGNWTQGRAGQQGRAGATRGLDPMNLPEESSPDWVKSQVWPGMNIEKERQDREKAKANFQKLSGDTPALPALERLTKARGSTNRPEDPKQLKSALRSQTVQDIGSSPRSPISPKAVRVKAPVRPSW